MDKEPEPEPNSGPMCSPVNSPPMTHPPQELTEPEEAFTTGQTIRAPSSCPGCQRALRIMSPHKIPSARLDDLRGHADHLQAPPKIIPRTHPPPPETYNRTRRRYASPFQNPEHIRAHFGGGLFPSATATRSGGRGEAASERFIRETTATSAPVRLGTEPPTH